MSSFRDYEQAALGRSLSAAQESKAIIPGIDSPVQTASDIFAFQSYFDSTLLSNAILTQNANEPIVATTMRESQLSGYGLALHPASQTPVAVQFRVGSGQQSSSITQILRPGDVVWPMGERGRAFSGFRWGLPFGWLGGGSATLVILSAPGADVKWTTDAEVIFHRVRVPILQPADITSVGTYAIAPKNWPMRFPWPQALRGSNSIPQQSKPSIAIVNPTRVLLALRTITSIAAGVEPRLRAVIQSSNDVGLSSTGAVVLTNPIFEEITFPQWTSLGASGNLSTQNPAILHNGLLSRVAADDGGIIFIDNSTPTASFNGGFVDCCRYGKL